jgi:hypothetical protein
MSLVRRGQYAPTTAIMRPAEIQKLDLALTEDLSAQGAQLGLLRHAPPAEAT